MNSIIDKITANKKLEVEQLKIDLPIEKLKGMLLDRNSFRFRNSLQSKEKIRIIAEIKKASPSRGILIEDFNPMRLASLYKKGSAAALSVLTEKRYFQGDISYMKIASDASQLPILCKDFIIDEYQIYHAQANYADAILIIASQFNTESLSKMITLAEELMVDALVEVHNEDELKIAIDADAKIIGVNNRNLEDFTVDLAVSERLSEMIPSDVIAVSESGIFTRNDIERLRQSRFNCFLIGEALVKAGDPEQLLKELQNI